MGRVGGAPLLLQRIRGHLASAVTVQRAQRTDRHCRAWEMELWLWRGAGSQGLGLFGT